MNTIRFFTRKTLAVFLGLFFFQSISPGRVFANDAVVKDVANFPARQSVANQQVNQPAATGVLGNPDVKAEAWKSYKPRGTHRIGLNMGFGVIDTKVGFTSQGAYSFEVLPLGFVPDIVNPVSVEFQLGPVWADRTTLWQYSSHLRWDFVKNPWWTLFAIGGLAGNYYDNARLGSRFAMHPRFGIGAFYSLKPFDLRADISHENITVGLSIPF